MTSSWDFQFLFKHTKSGMTPCFYVHGILSPNAFLPSPVKHQLTLLDQRKCASLMRMLLTLLFPLNIFSPGLSEECFSSLLIGSSSHVSQVTAALLSDGLSASSMKPDSYKGWISSKRIFIRKNNPLFILRSFHVEFVIYIAWVKQKQPSANCEQKSHIWAIGDAG